MDQQIHITLSFELATGKANLNEIVYRLEQLKNPLMLRILKEILVSREEEEEGDAHAVPGHRFAVRTSATIPLARRSPAATLPADLDRILGRALAKEPHDRYRDARDLAGDLRELRRVVESSASTSGSGARPAPAARGRWVRGTVVAGVVVLAAAGWWVLRERPEAPAPTRLRLLFQSQAEVSTPALSRDGSMIAFVVDEGGRQDLFVARTAGGGRVRLTDDPLV